MATKTNIYSLYGQPVHVDKYLLPTKNTAQTPVERACISPFVEHIEQNIGPVGLVYTANAGYPRIDLICVPPSEHNPYHRIITRGMSDLAMALSPEHQAHHMPRYVELMMSLPEDWHMTCEHAHDEAWIWPKALLAYYGYYPHANKTCLGWAHTLSFHPMNVVMIPNSEFTGLVVLPPMLAPVDFWTLTLSEDKTVHFYALMPLYHAELQYKLRYGFNALISRFNAAGLTELVDLDRDSVV